MIKDMSKKMTWHIKKVTILRRNVPVVYDASYHLLGYRILQDSKIQFRLQVESYISDWLFSKSRLLVSYVSRHKAMAYDRVLHFERPVELSRLNMAEKFLIRRCSNYVPSVHLSNGTFALRGHCVAFPQDISAMCNKLPLHKETMVVFIRYLGNKDTYAVYPKPLRVKRKNVLKALIWLKKHNPLYSDIFIRENNLDWMQGEEEVSIATNAEKSQTKNSKQVQIISSKLEFV